MLPISPIFKHATERLILFANQIVSKEIKNILIIKYEE
jgi:hypothetical protein